MIAPLPQPEASANIGRVISSVFLTSCINAKTASCCLGARLRLSNNSRLASSFLKSKAKRKNAFVLGLYLSVISSEISTIPLSNNCFNIGNTVFCPNNFTISLTLSSPATSKASIMRYSLSERVERSNSSVIEEITLVSLASFNAAGSAACMTSPKLHI
ncbi:hypothetical protein D3C71_1062100 [compost metagenome]